MKALLFGSIGTVTDTSELQRQAFNAAFEKHGLDWVWDRDEYRSLLLSSGGRSRVKQYAASRDVQVDADEVHATKTEIFQQLMSEEKLELRSGVAEALQLAKNAGAKIGLVSGTDARSVDRMKALLSEQMSTDLDVVTDESTTQAAKPSPDIYSHALGILDLRANEAVAIEDNVDGVSAAKSAGLQVIAFPGSNNAGHDFSHADHVVENSLEITLIQAYGDVFGLTVAERV